MKQDYKKIGLGSLIFYIPALILGYKFKNDFGAKLGKTLSLIMIIFLLITLFFYCSLAHLIMRK
ncbi:hypothetical protein [Paenibacillus selenitireducens]|uniref:hypothetical protein n=1 Tax=Paenibacillus selenitireducens TaxID=1324314 RepID=UPI001180FC14|nr:hypothetical protein [Paenibacillus selenitireducens]